MNVNINIIIKNKIHTVPSKLTKDLNDICRNYLETNSFPTVVDQFGHGLRNLQVKFRIPRFIGIKHSILEGFRK